MKLTLPPILENKLAEFRRRVWFVKISEAIFAAVAGTTCSYLLVFALDRFIETPTELRLVLLVTGVATMVVGVPLKWFHWVWKQQSLEDAARLLRRTFPRLGDQLLGIVELAHEGSSAAGRSERLVQAAMEQAAVAVKDKNFHNAVPNAKHHQWGWIAGGLLVAATIIAGLTTEAAGNAFMRWLTPWRNIERLTFTKIETLPTHLIVPFSEPFDLSIRLSSNTQRAPLQGTVQIGSQPRIQGLLKEGAYHLLLPPQKSNNLLTISIGDIRKSIELIPKPRPELTELSALLKLPDYLGYETALKVDIRGGVANVVKGAQAGFEAKISHALQGAQMDDVEQPVAVDKIRTHLISVSEDQTRKLFWTDKDGLSPRDPLTVKLRAIEDEPPRIIARKETQELVVLDSEVVTFDLHSTDDFGVKTIGLEWVGALPTKEKSLTTRGEKIVAAGGYEKKEVTAVATFCAVKEGVPPQSIEIRAWADDFLPNRKRTYSSAFALTILNKSDHALWLIEQFGKWLDAAKQGYDREQQLHQTNKELRELSAAELDRPENRRKVAQQAAAENGNAARMENLTESGRNLVEQATRNSEFDAARLESWAVMLKTLKDISARRMPSVADLLKQTANAQTNSAGDQIKLSSQKQEPLQPSKEATPTPSAQANNSSPSIQTGTPPSGDKPPQNPDNSTPPQQISVPNISNNESSITKPADPHSSTPGAKPEPPNKGKLGLPQTQVAGGPENKKAENPSASKESLAQQKIDAAINEQKELLTEFSKVSAQLTSILGSLESSTFVKRLKAASRQQMKLANDITKQTLSAFGIPELTVPEAQPIAKFATEQSDFVKLIQSDLEAYSVRKQNGQFKTVLDEMMKTEVVRALAKNSEQLLSNLSGQTVSNAEFWADTLDRWSEELVKSSKSKGSSNGSSDSLPPEIILKVMQALRDEMKLRDQTRETNNTKPAVDQIKFAADAKSLAQKQNEIAIHTASAMFDIQAIPQGAQIFEKELQLLTEVGRIMNEARGILGTPETGPTAIAAETEAIELLLQAKRSGSKSGGSGGSNPGNGGQAATASSSALSEIGAGTDANSNVITRPVGQSTGHAGKEFPAEFKTGLDTYFNQLEGAPK